VSGTGLLGGAFDPPHYGHVALADAALEHFALERLLVIPTGLAPHKEVETDAETRCRLAAAAFADRPLVEISRWEIDRGEPSYTIETTRWARERYGEIIFLVGADQFASLDTWKDPEQVLEIARLGVATRPGYPREELERLRETLPDPARVELFEIPVWPLSSTEIRDRVRRGESIDGFVPPAVVDLVTELGLYRANDVRGPRVH
jgi:nicotinate-nucleotide adenylyltransferase